VIDGDHDQAARFLAAASPCSVADLDRAYLPDGIRVVLREAQVTGDTARVDIDVAMPPGDPFSGSETFEKHTFRLTRSAGCGSSPASRSDSLALSATQPPRRT
jgi:hypothetical protein